MKKELTIKVKSKFVNKYKNGYPLIMKDALINQNELDEEGTIIKLVDDKNRFIAKGYYGRQNKGYGWILSQKENAQFDQRFFENKLKMVISEKRGVL